MGWLDICGTHARADTSITVAAFSHADNDDDDTEREYDRLRDLAREEANKRNQAFERVSGHNPNRSLVRNTWFWVLYDPAKN